MISRNLKKEYDIRIIASFIENKVLIGIDKNYTANKRKKILEKFEEDLFDFCSFITGENINYTNLSLYAPTIKRLLIEQYPNMNNKIINTDGYRILSEKEINESILKYKELYGDKIVIRSLKKGLFKTLRKTR